MSEEVIIAPLTKSKLQDMAVEYYGNNPASGTIRNAVFFAEKVLREADRLLEPWKLRKLCEIKGHRFLFEDGTRQPNLVREGGDLVLVDWHRLEVSCTNCDMKLTLVEGIPL